jgi:type II secretory ATPase GspE/PulE/Tfp pilus assembly ATPase PilB-like protein
MAELLPVTDGIHSMIVERKSAGELRDAALSLGMRPLQACGWEQVKRGLTTLDEILVYAEKGV